MFEQVLEEVFPEYEDKIDMYKVDIEKEMNMSVAFGARSIPYMVFISKSGEITSEAGVLNSESLKYYLEGLISKN